MVGMIGHPLAGERDRLSLVEKGKIESDILAISRITMRKAGYKN